MLILALFVILVIATILFIRVTNKRNMVWLKSRWMDCILFITTFISFIFSVGLTVRIAIYVSDYNVSVDAIMGGLVMNLSQFFVPGLLFISSLILGIRLIKPSPKEQ